MPLLKVSTKALVEPSPWLWNFKLRCFAIRVPSSLLSPVSPLTHLVPHWVSATSVSRVMLCCCCHAVSRVTSSVTCSPASGPLATGSHLGTVSRRCSCVADSRGAAARCGEMSRPRKLNIRGPSCVWVAWVKIAPLTTPAHGKSENRLRGSGPLMSSS